jgi:hypothetical protein
VRTRAFGIDLEADFEMPGVVPSPQASDGRSLSLRLADDEEVDRDFPADARRIAELRFDDDRLVVSVDAAGEHGYRVFAFDFGRARIAPEGREALIAPLAGPDWMWQRYLTGQVLPLAALLQGLEVFHACVLGVAGRAIAVVAHSGIGKTTTALRLRLKGLDFMSDDVLVLEPDGDRVRAHPGIGLANVRPGADDLLAQLESSGLATPIGRNERETRISIRRSDEVLPLAALFLLTRYIDERELQVERLAPVDPRMLLAATFNRAVLTPERLARQLDVCARVERSAAVFKVTCGISVPSADVADAIFEHVTSGLPC